MPNIALHPHGFLRQVQGLYLAACQINHFAKADLQAIP